MLNVVKTHWLFPLYGLLHLHHLCDMIDTTPKFLLLDTLVNPDQKISVDIMLVIDACTPAHIPPDNSDTSSPINVLDTHLTFTLPQFTIKFMYYAITAVNTRPTKGKLKQFTYGNINPWIWMETAQIMKRNTLKCKNIGHSFKKTILLKLLL